MVFSTRLDFFTCFFPTFSHFFHFSHHRLCKGREIRRLSFLKLWVSQLIRLVTRPYVAAVAVAVFLHEVLRGPERAAGEVALGAFAHRLQRRQRHSRRVARQALSRELIGARAVRALAAATRLGPRCSGTSCPIWKANALRNQFFTFVEVNKG
jgi:hypothetical protein